VRFIETKQKGMSMSTIARLRGTIATLQKPKWKFWGLSLPIWEAQLSAEVRWPVNDGFVEA
jgi:hypothetical protein